MQKTVRIAAGVLTLALGGAIYALYRPHTLLYRLIPGSGSWHRGTDVLPLPEWVVYNLPGLLWSAAYILLIEGCEIGRTRNKRLLWALVMPAVGVVSELLQGVHVLPGVFDELDLGCYALPYIIYIVVKR